MDMERTDSVWGMWTSQDTFRKPIGLSFYKGTWSVVPTGNRNNKTFMMTIFMLFLSFLLS